MPGQIGNGVMSECPEPVALSLATWQGGSTSLLRRFSCYTGMLELGEATRATSQRQEADGGCRPVGEDSCWVISNSFIKPE